MTLVSVRDEFLEDAITSFCDVRNSGPNHSNVIVSTVRGISIKNVELQRLKNEIFTYNFEFDYIGRSNFGLPALHHRYLEFQTLLENQGSCC